MPLHRRLFNTLPTPQEIEMLRRWATAERLQISAHLARRANSLGLP